ncbi:hypothetical protein GV054_08295 [Marinomonas mediterranea]|jgi:hypothetical protein|uniref:Uncharacterized protein n=1 Tax=Marinomonas mediterranea (strain ATCC 700492 / JCM 21426 / NBRC 103028 / MMB-1) TaxID=717774 RepID=F2JZS9_MARM1|nr:hypothetical protein [Marinomonas mediterranea]ADZ90933.1 hypothetical protein Marme_1674 [Marinomonas mediterranea MMB-1]WCN13003.1 hypothetical protein GV054_08295 [Marinomonas mediterranea]WCN17076.1 hypothetical protein GV053_08475 [Marinomonas mediterranea MMB-1]
MSNGNNTDWFARVVAVLGLVLACASIVLPYVKDISDSQEAINITAKPESGGGILRLSGNLENSRAIQIPWVFTISNTGKVTFSITSYTVHKLEGNGGVSYFSGLDGGLTDSMNRPVAIPFTLNPGESESFRLHLGYVPEQKVEDILRNLFEKIGPVEYQSAFHTLAKQGLTFYGGDAVYREFEDGNTLISIESFDKDPVYQVSFGTGRGNSFAIVTSTNPAY